MALYTRTEDGIGTNQNYFLSIVLFFFQTPTLSKTNFEPHLGPACPKLTHPLCRCCNRLFGVGGRERFSGRLFCVGIEFLSATTLAKGKVKRWFPPIADCPGNCLVCKSNDPQLLIKRPPGLFALGWECVGRCVLVRGEARKPKRRCHCLDGGAKEEGLKSKSTTSTCPGARCEERTHKETNHFTEDGSLHILDGGAEPPTHAFPSRVFP